MKLFIGGLVLLLLLQVVFGGSHNAHVSAAVTRYSHGILAGLGTLIGLQVARTAWSVIFL